MSSTENLSLLGYNSPSGRLLVREILAKNEPKCIVPHDHQVEGICNALDGNSLIATMATGGGKTGFYSFLMIVMVVLSENQALLLNDKPFPRNPCLLLISPTKALQIDIQLNMAGFGVTALVINADTCHDAREMKRDLWIEARDVPTVLILSPEELSSNNFTQLINNKVFIQRISVYGVDELHLLYWWGKSFRVAFQQVGYIRHRLPLRHGSQVPLIGTTATLRSGHIQNTICSSLGLEPGAYHLIRRSNMRHDIQLIFREMKSGIGGSSFPELDWILKEGRNTVIFCKTIALGFRVACYLWKRAKEMRLGKIEERVRLYNSLNWPSYNNATLGFLNNNNDASVTIATDVLSVGWDSQFTEDAIILGEPEDVDEFVQKIGRVGRNRRNVSHPRGFLYHTKGALETARLVVDNYIEPTGETAKGLLLYRDAALNVHDHRGSCTIT